MSTKKKTAAKTPVAKPPIKEKTFNAVLPGFFEKPGNSVFYAGIAIIAFMAFFVFKDFLLLNKIYLYKDIGSDSLNETYPFMMQVSNYFKSYGSLSWSFNMGMGQDITHIAFYDPFDIVLYMVTPSKMIWLLGYKEYFKIILTGAVFYTFLRTVGRSKYSSLAGTLMLCFCGFMIIGSGWFMFSFQVFCATLLLLGFELLFQKNNPWLFPLPVFLLGISYPFILVLFSIFLTVYTIFRCTSENRKSFKDISFLLLSMLGLGIIGIAMSAPVLADHLKVMLESPRNNGPDSYSAVLSGSPVFQFSDMLQLGTSIERFFCSEILGTGTNIVDAVRTNSSGNFRGWNNMMEAPAFYCGIPCLILTPLLFGYLSKKQKTIFGIVLALWLLPIIFPYFRYALWFFTGDYYRTYSLFVALIFIIYSVMCLDKLLQAQKINIVLLSAITIGLLLLQMLPYFDDDKTINSGLSIIAKLLVIAYAGIILWLVKAKNKQAPMYVFLLLLAVELTSFSSLTVNRNTNITASEMTEKTGYNDYSIEAVNFIKKTDPSFYRIDKNFSSSPAIHGSLNDAMVNNYYGTSSYSSFNQKYYIQYLRAYGVISATNEYDSRWAVGLANWPIVESLNSVKYFLAQGSYNSLLKLTHDSIAKFGNVVVLKSKYVLPFGYSYNKYIRESEFEKLSPVQKSLFSLKAVPVNDTDASRVKNLKELHFSDTIAPSAFSFDVYKVQRDSLGKDSMQLDTFSPVNISGKILLTASKLIFISMPYDIGWHIFADGKEYKPILVGNGMIGIALDKGRHSISMKYKPPYRKEAIWCSAAGIFFWVGLSGFAFWRRRKTVGESINL